MTSSPRPIATPDSPRRVKLDQALRAFARALLHTYFREIEVVGIERFPKSAPAIVVGNHFNSLIDGVLLTAFLPRTPRLIASSSVWDNRMLRPLLTLGGVIPIVRRQDAGHEKHANTATFARAAAYLQRGGVLALFPEGVSHSAPALQPMKSGAARIALSAAGHENIDDVCVVPVGLIFDEKSRFRSRALVEVGDPLPVDRPPGDVKPATVRALTDRISNALDALTPGYESWEEAYAVAQATTIWVQQSVAAPSGEVSLADQSARMRAFRDGYHRLRARDANRAASIRRDIEAYLESMQSAGVRDADVDTDRTRGQSLFRNLLGVLIRMPLAAPGLVLNAPPFWLTVAIGRRQSLDKRATFSLFHAIWAFPLFWIVLSGAGARLAGLLGGPPGWAALGILGLSIIGGATALGVIDNWRDARSILRAQRWQRRHPDQVRTLREVRGKLVQRLKVLVAEDARSSNNG
ncbi:MAG: lysophospholipid acyltransferase family protein [Pseudomonadota bacterium]